ncbi:MAG: COG4223 family protein [Rhodoplanes sp.]
MAHKKKRPVDGSCGKFPQEESAAAEPPIESTAGPGSGDTPVDAASEETMAQTTPADTTAHASPDEPTANAAPEHTTADAAPEVVTEAGAPADSTSGAQGAETRSETYGVEDAETRAASSGAEGAETRSETFGVEGAETHATTDSAEGAETRSEIYGVEDAETRATTDGAEDGVTRTAAESPESTPELAAPALAPEAQTAARERRRTPWGAMLASGLIGGALVALAMGYAWLTYMSDEGLMNVLWARLGAVELAVRDLNTRGVQSTGEPLGADELATRLTKLEAALAAAPGSGAAAAGMPPAEGDQATPDPALAPRLAALEAVAKSLADGLALLDRRADETASTMQQLRARAEGAIRAGGEPGATARQQPPAIGKAEFDALAERVASLQQAAASLQQSVEQTTASLQQTVARGTETAAADRAVRFALVASGLRGAVERGTPYSGELNAAKALAPDPQLLAPLEPFAASGVPTAEALGRELAALAPQLAQTGNAAARDTGYLERLQAHAERLVRVRPVNEVVAGDDVTAVVARIEAKAKQADLAAALTELHKLPEFARAPAAAWMKKAEGREAAVAAAQRTENAALAALANP